VDNLDAARAYIAQAREDELPRIAAQEATTVLIGANRIQLTDDHDRLTMRMDMSWESVMEDPVSRTIIASQQLGTVGLEPYIRKVRVTTEEMELPLGDIPRDKVGYVMIVNLEGTKLKRNPTTEEQLDIDRRVVMINGFEIHPNGMAFLGCLPPSGPVRLQCLHGTAALQVCLFPR
jgi:hypothetical protein